MSTTLADSCRPDVPLEPALLLDGVGGTGGSEPVFDGFVIADRSASPPSVPFAQAELTRTSDKSTDVEILLKVLTKSVR